MSPSPKRELPPGEHTFSVSHHYEAADSPGFVRTVGAGQLTADEAREFIADRLAGPPYRWTGDADEAAEAESTARHGRRAQAAGKTRSAPAGKGTGDA